MILTPHILIGAAIGYRFDNYFAIFGLSILSHFFLDAIPHWEYFATAEKKYIRLNKKKLRQELRHLKKNDAKISQKYKIALDLLFGLALAYFSILFITKQPPILTFMAVGIFGALFPDGITLLYFNLNLNAAENFQICHFWIHCQQILTFFQGLIINLLIYAAFIAILLL